MQANLLEPNPVTKVPPEVWEMIANNVNSGKDLASLSKAVPICGKLCYPKRREWLFEQVLPLLLTLSKDLTVGDILSCRRVCKRWAYSVDGLVENTVRSDYINQCHSGAVILPYKLAVLEIATMNRTKMLVLLKEGKGHPSNLFIGNCVKIEVPTTNRQGGIDLVRELLENFGKHIHFLHVSFHGKTDPTSLLNIFVSMLRLVPNLKDLVLEKFTRNSSVKPFTQARIKSIKRELEKFNENTGSSMTFKHELPKLESLNLVINGLCEHTFKNVLVKMFSGEYLKSLTLPDMVFSQGSQFWLSNLGHLNMTLKTNEEIRSILFVNCPNLEKLQLDLVNGKNINCLFVFQVLQKFQNTLIHLELTLPNFLETNTFIANGVSLIGDSSLMLFSESEYLEMPKLKVLTLLGFRPPSFNFIAGFRSLEYLNLYFERQIEWENFLKGLYHPDVENSEILDIVRKLKPVWSSFECIDKPIMRTSNLWSILPSLKSLKINNESRWESPGNMSDWQYRRYNFTIR